VRRWKRPRREFRSIIGYPTMVVLGVFLLVVLIKNSADRALWLALPLFGLGFALIWFVIRLGIYISDYGIRVISIRDWKTVPWQQVAAIEVSDYAPPELLVRTTLGHVIHTAMYRAYFMGGYEIGVPPASFDRMV